MNTKALEFKVIKALGGYFKVNLIVNYKAHTLDKIFNRYIDAEEYGNILLEDFACVGKGEFEYQECPCVKDEQADIMAMLPTEKEVDEWFTYRSENPPHTNIKIVRAIEGANKYRAIMLQRLEKLQGN
jgi:hypothetical protein